jgi:molybdate transport system ATP-binding protein
MSGLDFALTTRAGPLGITCALSLHESPLALVGPNGAGKTTVLLALLGLRPAQGFIHLGGVPLLDSAAGIDLPPERRRIGYVPQSLGLFPHLSALDNVAFGLRSRGLSTSEARQRAHHWLNELEVAALAARSPAALSGGERQRIALARALASEPAALLLDEPWAALDTPVRRRVRESLIARVRAQRIPTLLVTHDPEDVRLLDGEVAVLESGRIGQRGPWRALMATPMTPFTEHFFGAPVP